MPVRTSPIHRFIVLWVLVSLHIPDLFGQAAPNLQTDEVKTSAGPLRLRPLYHGSAMLEFDGKIIHIDPWSQADYSSVPQADLILITHTHADHMDAAIINKLKKASTTILAPPAVADTLNGSTGIVETISDGEKKRFLGIEIETVPMYNLVRGSEPGNPFQQTDSRTLAIQEVTL